MRRFRIAAKLAVKLVIAALFLAYPLVTVFQIVYFAAQHRLHQPDTWIPGRVAGGGDYLFAVIYILALSAVANAALSSARRSWREYREPEPKPLIHPPGANWAPAVVRVADEHVAGVVTSGADGEIVVPATRPGDKSDSPIAAAFMWIGHAVMLLTAVLTLYVSFYASEGAPVGIGFVFGLQFYVFAFLIRIFGRS